MLKYKYVEAKNGRPMYYKNGKMVKSEDIPPSVRSMLEPGVELTLPSPGESEETETTEEDESNPLGLDQETVDAIAENEAQSKKSAERKTCIFCEEPATKQRYINQRLAKLCDADYESHTTGEIAVQLKAVEED